MAQLLDVSVQSPGDAALGGQNTQMSLHDANTVCVVCNSRIHGIAIKSADVSIICVCASVIDTHKSHEHGPNAEDLPAALTPSQMQRRLYLGYGQ